MQKQTQKTTNAAISLQKKKTQFRKHTRMLRAIAGTAVSSTPSQSKKSSITPASSAPAACRGCGVRVRRGSVIGARARVRRQASERA
jgi:hypothetical protein